MDGQAYDWVKATREILLNQCSKLTVDELNTEFNIGLKSIKHTLIHIAGCYHAWLGSFILCKVDSPLFTDQQINDLDFGEIVAYFNEADIYVQQILDLTDKERTEIITRQIPWKVTEVIHNNSAYQLLVHSITHEFHHKGQIISMLRLLGHEVQSTDILNI